MNETTLTGESADIVSENIQKLKQLFPEVFCEDSIDFEKLQAVLGEYTDDNDERYNFTWWGKGRALRLAQTPSMGTLRPCKEESKDWDTTQNLYIEGDNLEVLKLLQKSYHGKVKVIYIDPPYNTGGDFVYPDDYRDPLGNYLELTGQVDEEGRRFSTNSDASGRYHTNWLNMMHPRLRLARNLLRNDGVVFISIDDNEQNNLRKLCDEFFGEDNFVACFPWRKRTAKSDVPFGVSQDYEWILTYARSADFIAAIEGGTRRYYDTPDLPNRPWRIHDLTKQTSASERPNSAFTIVNPKTGDSYPANPNRTWAITEDTFQGYYQENRIVFPGDYDFLNISKPAFRYFKADDEKKAGELFGFIPVSTNLPDDIGMTKEGTRDIDSLFDSKVFSFPKPVSLISYLVKCVTSVDNDVTIFDFFSGSATTAHAVINLNSDDGGKRKYIMVQLPEPTDEKSEAYKAGYNNICEIGKERIRRAGEQIKAELQAKQTNQPSMLEDNTVINPDDLDIGFKVFKLDTSNLKKWNPNTDNLETSLLDAIENYVEGRSELDVVYEIMLKYGIDLTLPLDEYEVGGKKIYSVGYGALMICLDRDITTAVANKIVRLKDELTPEVMRVVFKDNGFQDDSVKTNTKEILRNAGIDEIVSV